MISCASNVTVGARTSRIELLDEALSTGTPTNEVADRIARERIASAT